MTNLGLGTWHVPKKIKSTDIVCELMAGTRRIAQAAAKAGLHACSFEIDGHPEQDVLSNVNTAWVDQHIDNRKLALLWIGLVCASWSRARRNTSGKPGFPPPLRDSHKFIMGLPDLSPRDVQRVKDGNRQMRWAARRFRRAAAHQIACVIENPEGSRLWETPEFKSLMKRHPHVVIHYCAFGTSWRKATRLLFCHIELQDLVKFRCQGRGVCSYTGLPHQQLSGADVQTKRLWSSIASAYPPKLCSEVAARIR